MTTAALQPLPPPLEKILSTLLATPDVIQYDKVISKIDTRIRILCMIPQNLIRRLLHSAHCVFNLV